MEGNLMLTFPVAFGDDGNVVVNRKGHRPLIREVLFFFLISDFMCFVSKEHLLKTLA